VTGFGFPDCPNTPEFGQRVQAAANKVGGFLLVAVDQPVWFASSP
jgi:hypothetical protein